MDIYEALDKLKQNKRIDRTARRKQLVEKKLAESSDKKLTESLPQDELNEIKRMVDTLLGYLNKHWEDDEAETFELEKIHEASSVLLQVIRANRKKKSAPVSESVKRKPAKRLNESRRAGKKSLKEGVEDIDNVDDLIRYYINGNIVDAKVYCEDVMKFLEDNDLDPDYIYEYDIDFEHIEEILQNAADEITDYYLHNSYSPVANESLSESTNRYATKWAVVKLGYYDNGKGNGGLLYDKKKDEIVKEFEGEGKGNIADKDAYNKARELADKLNKKEGKLSNGRNRYEAQPMNTKTTKL